ncbi:flavoprotein [Planctomicrobium sp. SH668]|uniref:flavoprotein n=1 Tax=Planctomicrobium sp. SH668 TaxID=3448126 RepID=UPI003F5B6E99
MAGVEGREILVGVSGGVAAFKAADLVSKLVQRGAKVTVVMTRSAHQFIGETTFHALTDRPVYTETFSPKEHYYGEHIALARRAELFVITPATANVMGCIANGIAGDLLTTLAMAVTCPVLMAPAMNNEMWSKPPVQRNLEQLKQDGIEIVGPGEGYLSCGVIGPGRMAEPVDILAAIERRFA